MKTAGAFGDVGQNRAGQGPRRLPGDERSGVDQGHGEALRIRAVSAGTSPNGNAKRSRRMATNENGSFAGKVAFVTGAGTGIGRATALAFAREGAGVVAADLSEQDNRETARMIEEAGGWALPVGCDVRRTEDVKAALGRTIGSFGRLDVAFNNAGVENEVKE